LAKGYQSLVFVITMLIFLSESKKGQEELLAKLDSEEPRLWAQTYFTE